MVATGVGLYDAACPTHGPIQNARQEAGTGALYCACGLACEPYDVETYISHSELVTAMLTGDRPVPAAEEVVALVPVPEEKTEEAKPKKVTRAKAKKPVDKTEEGDE